MQFYTPKDKHHKHGDTNWSTEVREWDTDPQKKDPKYCGGGILINDRMRKGYGCTVIRYIYRDTGPQQYPVPILRGTDMDCGKRYLAFVISFLRCKKQQDTEGGGYVTHTKFGYGPPASRVHIHHLFSSPLPVSYQFYCIMQGGGVHIWPRDPLEKKICTGTLHRFRYIWKHLHLGSMKMKICR